MVLRCHCGDEKLQDSVGWLGPKVDHLWPHLLQVLQAMIRWRSTDKIVSFYPPPTKCLVIFCHCVNQSPGHLLFSVWVLFSPLFSRELKCHSITSSLFGIRPFIIQSFCPRTQFNLFLFIFKRTVNFYYYLFLAYWNSTLQQRSALVSSKLQQRSLV